MSDNSDSESFKSATTAQIAGTEDLNNHGSERFTPDEEAALLAQSNDIKKQANSLFGTACYSDAVQSYDKALASCPNYLDYELAVLRSNIAACHVKLRDWKAAVEAASKSLESLERLDPTLKVANESEQTDSVRPSTAGSVPLVEEVDDDTAAKINELEKSGHSRAEVQRIRVKSLMRRAKARVEIGGWASLEEANGDYHALLGMPALLPLDRKAVDESLRTLRPRLEAAKQEEMGEMMGKLKDLGNGILKPFGLSTDNFQFTKDEVTGGYSMQFNQGNSDKK